MRRTARCSTASIVKFGRRPIERAPEHAELPFDARPEWSIHVSNISRGTCRGRAGGRDALFSELFSTTTWAMIPAWVGARHPERRLAAIRGTGMRSLPAEAEAGGGGGTEGRSPVMFGEAAAHHERFLRSLLVGREEVRLSSHHR